MLGGDIGGIVKISSLPTKKWPIGEIRPASAKNYGFKLLEYDFGSSEIKSVISKSKFKDMPFFAKNNFGYIGLQGDHGEVWYRNIRIKKL